MNNREDLVQIVIPCFNGAEYLEETLSSIQKQTFQNFDCLLIDDGSTDNTSNILRSIAVNDSRFRVIKNHQNEGESFSVNRGWINKQGKLISILSCDDPQPEDWLETITDFREKNPGFVVYYPNRIVIDEKGAFLRREELFDWSISLLEEDLLCIVSVGAIIDSTLLPDDFLPRIPEVIFPSDLIQYLKIAKFGSGLRHPSFFAVWREHKKSKSAEDKRILAREFTRGMSKYLGTFHKEQRRISESVIFAHVVRILQSEFTLIASVVVGFRIFLGEFDFKSLRVTHLMKIIIRFRGRKNLWHL
jgi:glycosyltransferase involved in cell wall biosynthesis